MTINLNESIKTLNSDAVINETISAFDESKEHITKAIQLTIPVVLLQLTSRVARNDSSYGIYRMVKVAEGSNVFTHLTEMFQGKAKYQGILNMTSVALGDLKPELILLLKTYSGMQEKNILPFLRAFVPAILSTVGQFVKKSKMSQAEFSDFMIHQKAAFSGLLPVDLPVSEMISKLQATTIQKSNPGEKVKKPAKKNEKVKRFKIGFSLFLLVLISLFFFLMK